MKKTINLKLIFSIYFTMATLFAPIIALAQTDVSVASGYNCVGVGKSEAAAQAACALKSSPGRERARTRPVSFDDILPSLRCMTKEVSLLTF